MSIQNLFHKNPFQNLVIASRDAASFALRGHEDQFDAAINAIENVVSENTYNRENLRHTIVFGEWGHGKTHLLRSIELKINQDFAKTARAIFYEPSTSDPGEVISELGARLDINCSNVTEFIDGIQKDGRHQFLLIDESQSLVGEDIHGNYETEVGGYYQLLGNLLDEAHSRHVNLHIFHGLSANSAKAIEKMRAIKTILDLAKNVFTLNSLSEEDQWHMLEDHVEKTLKDSAGTNTEDIISRCVNRTVNKLTGGNPRWVMMLMHDIYLYAANANRSKIDERTCYEALRQTARIDEPSRKYFDPFLIDEVLDRLKGGQIHEQRIAGLLGANWASLLGGWSTVSQAQLAGNDLTSAQVRKQCPSIRNMRLLEQTDDADFRLSQELIDELKITTLPTILKGREREQLMRLSLQPEKMLRNIIGGFESVLRGCHSDPKCENNFGGDKLDALFFDADTPALPDGLRKLRIGLAIYKGIEVPMKFYEASAAKIEQGGCGVMVLIEDALNKHSSPGSTFQNFKTSYAGPILVEKRFIFINGSDGHIDKFGENFFVSLLDTNIDGDKARRVFESIRLKNRIEEVVSESIYCPTEQERELILRLQGTGSSFNLGELSEIDASLAWVTKQKLSALSDFIEKRGSRYSRKPLQDIIPIKRLLKALSEKSTATTQAELENLVRHNWILTGTPESTQRFPEWCITLIEKQGLLKRDGELVSFRNAEKETSDLKLSCEKLVKEIDQILQDYTEHEFSPDRIKLQKLAVTELIQRIKDASVKELNEQANLLQGCKADAIDLKASLSSIPSLVQEDLQKEVAHIAKQLDIMNQKAAWDYPDLDNPSLTMAKELQGQFNAINAMIAIPLPFEKAIRNKIERLLKEIEVNIEELDRTLPPIIDAPDNEIDIDQAALFLFAALRAKRKGSVTVNYSELITGDSSPQN